MIRRTLIPLLLVGFVGLAGAARAQDNPALYQATAIVTGTDMRQRPQGMAECLTEVLVKVSGMPRLQGDPRVAALARHADALVDQFSYLDPDAWRVVHDDQGTYDRPHELTVRFNPAKIDAALAALGLKPWTGKRPLLVPIIIVRRDATPFLLSATTPRGTTMREAIVQVASEYGMGVHFPTENDFAAWGITLIGFPAPLGASGPGQVRIAGSLDWNVKAFGWIGTWHVRTQGVAHDWRISGVSFDQAFADMIRGAVTLAHDTRTP